MKGRDDQTRLEIEGLMGYEEAKRELEEQRAANLELIDFEIG